jgi:carbamoyl-phosphate synthase small subunit
MKAALALVDGTVIQGEGFGAEKEVFGEVVFTTSMSGYQEGLTDPSYKGQILMPTYPMIGNYGINPDDYESDRIQAEGFIVRENCHIPNHRLSEMTIDQFLKKEGIPGISGVDTRALTIKIRQYGVLNGGLAVSEDDIDTAELLEKAKNQVDYSQRDLIREVTCSEPRHFPGKGKKVVVIDCGMKLNILRSLQRRGCEVTVVPAFSTADQVLEYDPDGVLVSPGPGDPQTAPYVMETIKALMGERPLFGICMGHQLLALAAGGRTYKLKFGHRGANQPVKDLTCI